MTCILSAKGTTPDGKLFAKISGIQYTLPHAMKKDLDKFSVEDEIEFNETNGIITRLWKPKKTYQKVPVNGNGKNEKLIVMQHNFGIVAESYFSCFPGEEVVDFDAVMNRIYMKTKEISDLMMQDCGAN